MNHQSLFNIFASLSFMAYALAWIAINVARIKRLGYYNTINNPWSLILDAIDIVRTKLAKKLQANSVNAIEWFEENCRNELQKSGFKLNPEILKNPNHFKAVHTGFIASMRMQPYTFGPTTQFIVKNLIPLQMELIKKQKQAEMKIDELEKIISDLQFKAQYERMKREEELFEKLRQQENEKYRQHKNGKTRAHDAKQSKDAYDWRSVLELSHLESDPKVIKVSYRRLAMKYHPDRGGSAEKMSRINKAFEEAKIHLGF